MTAESQLAFWRALFGRHVEGLEHDLAQIKSILAEDGHALIDVVGWPAHLADDYRRVMEMATLELFSWSKTWTMRNQEGSQSTPEAEDALDQDEAETDEDDGIDEFEEEEVQD
jgi:hypothetical protein